MATKTKTLSEQFAEKHSPGSKAMLVLVVEYEDVCRKLDAEEAVECARGYGSITVADYYTFGPGVEDLS